MVTVRARVQVKVNLSCGLASNGSHPSSGPVVPAPAASNRVKVAHAHLTGPCDPLLKLHLTPHEERGSGELAGGFYSEGGGPAPALNTRCAREAGFWAGPNTVTVASAQSGQVVARQTVGPQRFVIALPPGDYLAETEFCASQPVHFTVRPEVTVRLDFGCSIR